ncbi:MAG: PqiC family protein, partial [Actinomycetota bacterium]|nr:PqiC family protein [Actinomycetota bacterium]
LEACTSMPSRFYILNSLSASETTTAMAAEQGPVIGVGPITIPKYLDRPQIVTRAGSNQLALAEFDRWAEPLQDNLARVLAENLALLIPTDQILLYAWPRSATLDYQVMVEVLHFDGWLGSESRLLALWSILDGAELTLWSQRATLNAPVSGREYEAMVVAMNQLIEWLSRDLASAIHRLASRVVARE